MNSGIYTIVNRNTGKRYVGSAVDVDRRWREHKRALQKNKHHSILLQRAWDKYGNESFEFYLIESVEKDFLLSREQCYLDVLRPEYNICKTAGSQFGLKRSKETRQRQSNSLRGEKHPNYGKHLSEEARKNISISLMGNIPWNKGKKGVQLCSEETREKMRESRRRYLNGT